MAFEEVYLTAIQARFRAVREPAEQALGWLNEEQFHQTLAPDTNSVALLIQHMANNMTSRWTDFLTTDGEKPDRNRDAEFVDQGHDKEILLTLWNDGWQLVESTLASLTPNDLERTVLIRGEPHLVVDAIERQLAHYAYHTGQLIFLMKILLGPDFKPLTIPLPHQRH